jgi:hypothetical protein
MTDKKQIPKEIARAFEAFDIASSTLAGQIWIAPGDGDEADRTQAELFSEIRRALIAAYDAGFAASGEEWNGEYPDAEDRKESYERTRAEWLEDFAKEGKR